MLTVGVLGASGFIGNRTVEFLSQKDEIEVRPIVRAESSLARLSRSDLDYRIANALDLAALKLAFDGCDVVIHSVLGSPGLIRGAVVPAYQAAQATGVRRLIYLSTFCVHGQTPELGITEDSPLNYRQPFPYNRAKIAAEQKLMQLRQRGKVEVVIFRPGIVFGPRSSRIVKIVEELVGGNAYLINEGKGICNTVYIDNLVQGMYLALTAKGADGQAFFVGDDEVITWVKFYYAFAKHLGLDSISIAFVDCPKFKQTWRQRYWRPIWSSTPIQKLLSLVSDEVKQKIKNNLSRQKLLEGASKSSKTISNKEEKPPLMITKEMATLQKCQYHLPGNKAQEILGYKPIVAFEEGCQKTIHWLTSQDSPLDIKQQKL